jgi:hypothetical protein
MGAAQLAGSQLRVILERHDMGTKFENFDQFFLHYLRQHSNRANRLLHALGTTIGLGGTIAAVYVHHPWYALLWIPIGYAFSWAGHLVVEGNHPATWGHPLWSLASDFRMLGLMLTGRLRHWLADAEATEPRATSAAAAQD